MTENKPVVDRCNASCARTLGCYTTRWRPIDTAPKNGIPILAMAKRNGWPGNGTRCCVVWSFGRWVIYGACKDEPMVGITDIQPLDEVQPYLWQHIPGRPPESKNG